MVAALVAAGSVVLLLNYVNAQKSTTATGATVTSTESTRVVVATADLLAGDKLSTANVGLQDYPTAALPAGGAGLYFNDVTKLLSPVQYVATKLPRGTLILATLLVSQPGGSAVTQPPVDIQKPGDVAISIPYGESNGAGGYVQAEDHIDILVDDGSGTVHYAFQDVRVIKVGGRAEQTTAAAAASGTANLLLIELPREQAAALSYLEDRGFSIRYAVRPHDEFGKGSLPNSAPVSGSNWTTFLDG